MKQIIIATILIFLMSGIASAEQIEDWPYEKRNVIPIGIEGVRYDFEEGRHMMPFNNLYPEIATFLTVVDNEGYSSDEPSYVDKRARAVHIYPKCFFHNPDGTPVAYIYIVNNNFSFVPRDGPDILGKYWTGGQAFIRFKEDTHYVSFLTSTGASLNVQLYDKKNNLIHYEKIIGNTDRIDDNPSEFTQFSIHMPNIDIVSMGLSGTYTMWLIDDLVIGGGPGYLPGEPIDDKYSYAAERLKELIGVEYEGTGRDYLGERYYTAQEIIDGGILYWDADTKELMLCDGIYDEDAILWAFNENEEVVNWKDINKMASSDFKIEVQYGEQRPGDVFFLDYNGDGSYDEVGIFIEPMIDDTSDMVDIIRIIPDVGVHYSTAEFIHALYGTDASIDSSSSMACRRLPDFPKGGHSPYPKIPTKFFI